MNTIRYYAALMLLVSMPVSLGLWFAIHPFAPFWRRLGPVRTYAVLALPSLAVMAAMFHWRRPLLRVQFGTNRVFVSLAVVAVVASVAVAVQRRKHLTFAILAGVPELSEERAPGRLLTEGIYGRIRHPRYVEATLAVLAYALFANYLAVWVLLAAWVPGLYLVVLLEERELRDRFGSEYLAYCRRVPRFLPRIGSPDG